MKVERAAVSGAMIALLGIATLAADQAEEPEAAEEAAEAAEEEPTYHVVDGKADPDTVRGYLTYTAKCMPCHGPDGLGSSFAPSLVRAVQRRTFDDFQETVRNGRSILPGQVMPPFGDDAVVMAHVDDIWRYLKARADGVLGRGRPEVLEAGN